MHILSIVLGYSQVMGIFFALRAYLLAGNQLSYLTWILAIRENYQVECGAVTWILAIRENCQVECGAVPAQ